MMVLRHKTALKHKTELFTELFLDIVVPFLVVFIYYSQDNVLVLREISVIKYILDHFVIDREKS